MTHTHSITKSAILAALLLFPASAFCQVNGVIGVKFGFTSGSGYAVSTDLAPTDAAGILIDGDVPVTNWNDLLVGNASSLSTTVNVTWPIAQDSAGNNLSGVTVTPAGFNDGWYSGGNECPNARLLESFWKLNLGDKNAGAGTNAAGHVYATLTFSGLSASTYDVYVYVNDNNGNYWGNIEANSVIAVGTNVDDAGFNGDDRDPCGLTPQLHTATGFGNPANYMEMPAVATTAGGTIVISIVSFGGGDIGIPGVELVPTGTSLATYPPLVGVLTESPASASIGVEAGTAVTLTDEAYGELPISYLWQTDGGSGITPTNIPGATSSNLVVNTTGWVPGTYVYDFTASNTLGTATSAKVNIVIPVTDPAPAISVQFAGDGSSELLTTGEAAGYVPHIFWNVDTNQPNEVDSNLVDYTGATTAASVTVNYFNGRYHSSDNTGTADGILMSGGFWSGGGYTITASNVPYSSYEVFLYILNDNNPDRRYEFVLGNQTNWGAVFNGNGYSIPPYTLDTQTEELPRGSGAGDQIEANLIKFTNISGSSFTINGTTPDGNVALMGMEILNPGVGPAVSGPISLSPSTGTIYAGLPVTLTELPFSGAPPLYYQWLTDGGTGGSLTNIPSATNGTLTVDTTTFASGNFSYEVVVTNASGSSTSAVQTVTITASAPIIVTDITPPANEGYVGETVTYSAVFGGTYPINYQWSVDTGGGPTPISGAGNPTALTSTLVLSNLQVSEAGTYTLTATNSVGSTTTSPSTLTVLTDLPAPGAGTFGAVILSNNPVAYWRLNETEDPLNGDVPAYDASGHNLDGLYAVNTENGANGINGPQSPTFPGFEANNYALYTQNDASNSFVTVPTLDLTTNTVTITMWIQPTTAETVFNSLFKFQNDLGNDAAGFGFGPTTNGSLSAALGYTWNSNSAATYNWNSGLFPPKETWSFVALVITPADATIYLYYIDPITSQPDLLSAVNPVTNGVETFNDGTIMIGSDPFSPLSRSFSGDIDEVAVYAKALSSEQILAMFGTATGLGTTFAPQISVQPQSVGAFAGKTVTFAAAGINGTSPFTYQWQYVTASTTNNLTDGGELSGSKTGTLTISNVATANAGTYQVVVSNSVGAIVSSNASLSVLTPTAGSYAAAVLQYDPLAYWPLNETTDPTTGTAVAYEYASFFNGVYGKTASNGFEGILGPESPEFPGFAASNTALKTFVSIANSYVSASGGDLIATNITYTAWIDPSGPVANWAGILMDRGSSTTGTGFGFGGTTNSQGVSELAYTWNQNNQDTWGFNSLLFPATNEWSFVALVVEPSQATIYLIGTNGVVQTANNAIPQDSEEFAVAWHIGNDAADGGNGGRTFSGSISSVAVFLSALSSGQLLTLADTGFGVTPPPVLSISPSVVHGELTLTWSSGTLLQTANLLGPWVTNAAATSPYTVSPTNAQQFFKVVQ